MSGLFGSLDVALQSLLTQQGALRATTENLANLSTPFFTRRRAVISELSPTFQGGILIGRGSQLSSIESVRDRVLELRISSEQQRQSATETFIASMSSIETLFGSGAGSLGAEVQDFFNSLNRLSTNPVDGSLRQGVLTAAGDVSRTFESISQSLRNETTQLNTSVTQTVDEVNRLTEEIAAVNQQVATRQAIGEDAGALEDQRTQLISELSSKIDLFVTDTPEGYTLTTVHGAPLVVAGESYRLDTSLDTNSNVHIVANGTDVTSDLSGGQLGGLLQARDRDIASLQRNLDAFAFQFVAVVNDAHRQGFDLNGNAGGDLFTISSTEAGAANAIRLAISDPDAIAASGDPAAGGNGNLLSMLNLQNQNIIGGRTPSEAYASLVFQVGGAVADAKADQSAGDVVLNQLNELRGAISGVSIDEESANMIRFQQAYEASARVIAAINEMLDTAVNLGRM